MGLEMDAVACSQAGPWTAFDAKLGVEARIEEAAGNLLKFQDRVDTGRSGKPAMPGVIVGSGPYAYRRDDRIWVLLMGVCCP
jgi:uncharacterized protein